MNIHCCVTLLLTFMSSHSCLPTVASMGRVESTISGWGRAYQTSCSLATYPSNSRIIFLYTYFPKSLYGELFYPDLASQFWVEIIPMTSMSYHYTIHSCDSD